MERAGVLQDKIDTLTARINSLGKDLDKKDAALAAIAKKQYESIYELAPVIIYDHRLKRLVIHNNGKSNFIFFGSKLGNGPPSMEGEPRTLAPGSHYYLLAETLAQQVQDAASKGSELRGPFDVYVRDGLQRKWIVGYLLWGRVENGLPVIHTQFVKLEMAQWPKA